MKQHKTLFLILFICMIPPITSYFAYINGYHGSGFSNKGKLLKPLVVDKTLDNFLKRNQWNIFSIKNSESSIKFIQIKKVLGQKSLRVNAFNLDFLPKSLVNLYNKKYTYFVADPKRNIILAYKNKNWQNNVYKDIKHLLKTNQ